ncbi:MAG: hypothetical protein ACP5I1_20770, partial [Candidatus Hinthialibacter sp.]
MKHFFSPPHPSGSFPPDDLMEWKEPARNIPWWSWLGLTIILISETLLFFQIEPIFTHFTLIVWWGYILLLDGLIKRRRGVSWLADKPLFFLYLALISAFWWLVFEFYNCYLENWIYIGLPQSIVYRYICYLLAYATITPAILLTYLFVLTYWPSHESLDLNRHPRKAVCYLWLIFGMLCVSIPLLIPQREIRHYLFGFVWIGYVFMLEPISYWSGGYSLLRLWTAGARRTVWLMFGSGALCGLLWEFWNYWAGAKWLYTVPVLPSIRYFEMPIIGFLGFLPFAWECLMLVMFSSLILNRFPFNSNRKTFPKEFVWKSRCLLAGLIGLFLFTYYLQPNYFFPITDFDPFWKKQAETNHEEWAAS